MALKQAEERVLFSDIAAQARRKIKQNKWKPVRGLHASHTETGKVTETTKAMAERRKAGG